MNYDKENKINLENRLPRPFEFETPQKSIFSISVSPPKHRPSEKVPSATTALPKPIIIDLGEEKPNFTLVDNNDDDLSSVVVKMQPFEAAPCLNFGCVDINRSESIKKQFSIYNPTEKVLLISISKPPSDAAFTLEFPSKNTEAPLRLEAGAHLQLEVTWKPNGIGNIRDSIEFRSTNGIKTRLVLLATGSQVGFSTVKKPRKAHIETTFIDSDNTKKIAISTFSLQTPKRAAGNGPLLQSSGVKPLRTPSTFFMDVEESPMAPTQTFRVGVSSPTKHGQRGPRISTVRKPLPSTARSGVSGGDALTLSNIFAETQNTTIDSNTSAKPVKADAPVKKGLSRLAQKALEQRPSLTATATSEPNKPKMTGKRPATTAEDSSQTKRQKVVFSRAAEASKPAQPTSKPATISVDARWMEKQETMLTSWLNFFIAPSRSPQIYSDVTPSVLGLGPSTLLKAKQRSQAAKLFASSSTQLVLSKLKEEINQCRLRIRTDRLLYADVGIRQNIINLFMCYEPQYLELTLSVIYPRERLDTSKLNKFIASHVLFDRTIAAKFESTAVKGHYRNGFKDELDKFTLEKVLMIVWMIEQFKEADVLGPECPRLFHTDSTIKSNKSLVTTFCKDYMAGEGDVIRHLALIGYKLQFEQSYMDEFDFQVSNIAVDLRDGIRLAKVVDVLSQRQGKPNRPSCVSQLRVPAVSRLQKIHNVDVVLNCLKESLHAPVNEVSSKDIVDGHRSKTLLLLWKTILMSEIPTILPFEVVNTEIATVQAYNCARGVLPDVDKTVNLSDESINYFQSPLLSALLKWCQVVCAGYGLPVTNFTSSFSDGKVLCALINFYFAEQLDWTEVKPTTRDMNKSRADIVAEQQDKPIDGNWVGVFSPPARVSQELRRALEGEKHNFSLVLNAVRHMGMVPCLVNSFDMSNTTPDEKVVITSVVYICARLLGMQRERKAAILIQRTWRKWYRIHVVEEKERAATIIQRNWRCLLFARHMCALKRKQMAVQTLANAILCSTLRRRYCIMKEAAIKLQSTWRAHLCRKQFLEKRSAATALQSATRSFLARRKAQREDAATLIQSCWRRHRQRQVFMKMKKAVATIERLYNARQQRVAYLALRDAAIKIQASTRMHLSKLRYRSELSSIELVQSLVRRRVSVQELLRQQSSALLLQSVSRGMLARKSTKIQMNAIGILQRASKAFLMRTKLQNLLACVHSVQEAARGYVARKTLASLKCAKFETAVVKCQAVMRGVLGRQRAAKQHRAVVLLQSIVRQRVAANEFVSVSNAAMTIQRYWRGMRTRKLIEQENAASRIQAWWRMIQQRRQFSWLTKASVTIQAHARGFLARQQYQEDKKNVIALQSRIRMINQKSDYARLRSATLLVQARWRKILAAKYEAEIAAATKIQSIARMTLQRKRFLQLKGACATIENSMFAALQRKQFLAMKNAAIRIQATLRMQSQRKNYLHQVGQIVHLQSRFRAALQKSQYEQDRANVLCIEAVARGYLDRAHARKRKAAVALLQKAWRSKQINQRLSELHRGILTIQGAARVYLAKKELSDAKELLRGSRITAIQASARGYLARKDLAVKREAATRIQAFARMSIAQAKFQTQRNAAILLQSYSKMFVAKKEFQNSKHAAVVAQSCYRRSVAVRKYKEARESITLAQSVIRSFLAARKYKAERESVITVQAAIRGYLARQVLSKVKAAVRIQAWWRMIQARNNFSKLKAASTSIQAAVRGFLTRRRNQQTVESIVLVQSLARAQIARKDYSQKQQAARKIQGSWRAFLLRKHEKRVSAALKIEAWWLMVQQRRRFLALKSAVATVENAYAANKQRTEFLKMRDAATKIQSFARMAQAQKSFYQEKSSVIKAQAAIRAALARRGFEIEKQSVNTLQIALRASMARNQFEKSLQAAAQISDACTRFLLRLRLKRVVSNLVSMQTACRAYLARKEVQKRKQEQKDQQIVLLQSLFRAYNARRIPQRKEEAATTIQALCRGVLTRRQTCRQIAQMRIQIEQTRLQTKKEDTLASRTKRALDAMIKSSTITNMLEHCVALEVSTRYSLRCAQQCLEMGLAPVLIKLVEGLNRSAPHMQLLKKMISVLSNVAYFKPLRHQLVARVPTILITIGNIMAMHRESPEHFLTAATLFDRLISDPKNAKARHEFELAEKGYAIKKLEMTHEYFKKRQVAEAKSAKHVKTPSRQCEEVLSTILRLLGRSEKSHSKPIALKK